MKRNKLIVLIALVACLGMAGGGLSGCGGAAQPASSLHEGALPAGDIVPTTTATMAAAMTVTPQPIATMPSGAPVFSIEPTLDKCDCHGP